MYDQRTTRLRWRNRARLQVWLSAANGLSLTSRWPAGPAYCLAIIPLFCPMTLSRCLVCGQPLSAQSRSDKLTCSPSCRTRRYRQAQQRATPKGSAPWRRQLQLTQPIHFFERTPDTHAVLLAQEVDPIRRPQSVPSAHWDATLVALNRLRDADEELYHVLTWPNNQWGANGDPVTGDTGGSETDIIWALQGHLDNLYRVVSRLQALRGRIERWLVPMLMEFDQQLLQLRQGIRVFSRQVEHLYTRYEIIYPPELISAASGLRAWIERWWFKLFDEVD